ncbi:MAG: efflux RND transporter periplasmic adaptor subunit [Chlorobi bacterium]|nr:efflux RND transporter periplasmic adaptor subunit [Chlorobiota bacterium]
MSKKNNTLKIVITLTFVALILAVIGKKAGWFGKAETIKVAIEQPKYRTITEAISANGRIQPETEVKLAPDVSGEIVELHVKEGERVAAGDLLVKIKPDVYVSARDRAIASLNSAKARLAQAQAQLVQSELAYKRSKKLFDQNTISRSEFENAEATYKMAKADVEAARYTVKSAEASVKEAQENLVKTTIYAPMPGIVSKLNVEKGERVVGTSMMAGTEIMRIADLGKMEVLVEVNENDIIRVQLGDTALVEVDAYLGDKFRGIVTEIANTASTSGVGTDQVTSFNVKIRLVKDSYKHLVTADDPYPFRPGMSATVDILTQTLNHVLSVPIQAVTTRTDTLNKTSGEEIIPAGDDEVKEVVFSVQDQYALMKEVKTGIQDDNFIQVISGINQDDKVITAPYSAISKKLQDSALVEVVPLKDLYKTKKKK